MVILQRCTEFDTILAALEPLDLHHRTSVLVGALLMTMLAANLPDGRDVEVIKRIAETLPARYADVIAMLDKGKD